MPASSAVAIDQAVLDACHREPIHIPGSIQPHGVLLAFGSSHWRLDRASANTEDWFGIPPEALLDQPMETVLGRDLAQQVEAGLRDGSIERNPLALTGVRIAASRRSSSFEVLAHRSGGSVVVELEESPADEIALSRSLYPLVRTFLSRLEGEPSVVDACQLAASEIRRITGTDRVLIYKFADNWDGSVVAEERNDVLPAYIGLKFPASDIPAQARALYLSNRLRYIPNASYDPAPILESARLGPTGPLDLSLSALRSVSPVHTEYMRNMGTGLSLSISILVQGKLWGLITAHNRDPIAIPPEVRMACDFLGQVLATQIDLKTQTQEFEQRLRGKTVIARLLEAMAEANHFVDALVEHGDLLLRMVRAEGAAILHEGTCRLVGRTPDEAQVDAIRDWLAAADWSDVLAVDALPETLAGAGLEEADGLAHRASGLLAVSISEVHQDSILWFRPEIVKEESWGGDPRKPLADADGRIHPRRSFEAWKETVRGRSTPWRRSEVDGAIDLRKAILEIVLRQAEERTLLTAELEQSNKELEAFSYSVSHDLRAPFRHIVGYAELLGEQADRLDDDGRRYLETITEAAQFAGTLVDNLLTFSKMGRAAIHAVPINTDALIREVVREVERDTVGRAIDWQIGSLPPLNGDRMMLHLALSNLVANAAKYTRARDCAIIRIDGEIVGDEVRVVVKDNGIGFDMKHVDKLFGVFQRLHRMEDYEGTGIGLANVHRIVTKHGGRVWAEGVLGVGATFTFALPQAPVAEPSAAPN